MPRRKTIWTAHRRELSCGPTPPGGNKLDAAGLGPYRGAGPSLAFRWSTTGERPTGLMPG
jgi:hypothetical protein